MGFDRVFDTNFTADLTIMEEGTELLTRLKSGARSTRSRSPLPHVHELLARAGSATPSTSGPTCSPTSPRASLPQQMFGAVAKTYYAEKIGKKPEDIFVVSVMPCTAKKYESQRPEMYRERRAGRGRGAHHARAGPHDQAGGHRFRRPSRRKDGQHPRGVARVPRTSSPTRAASWKRPCAPSTRS